MTSRIDSIGIECHFLAVSATGKETISLRLGDFHYLNEVLYFYVTLDSLL